MKETPKAIVGISKVLKYIFMIFIIGISVGPIFWAFISSFKTYAEINSSALSWPSHFSLDNYVAAFKFAPIGAYIVSRFDFKLKTMVVLLISASLMLPAQAISQPLFAIFQKLGIFDTKIGLIIVYSAMGIPMSFFVMTSYYKTISTALEESAYIDGASFLQTFLHIILPLAKPGLVTIALLQFINTWNEFYFALMLTSGDSARTVPIALNYYMGTFANNYSALFAAVVMTVLPTILVFIILQRQVMESLTAGAVKG